MTTRFTVSISSGLLIARKRVKTARVSPSRVCFPFLSRLNGVHGVIDFLTDSGELALGLQIGPAGSFRVGAELSFGLHPPVDTRI